MTITTQEDLIEHRDREELINGKTILSPRPTGKHLLAVSHLEILLGAPFGLGRGGPGGWWIIVEPQILIGRNKLIPDLAGWRRERLPKMPSGYLFEVTPDWVCEAISEGSRKMDRQTKPPIYLQDGVKHLWLIEPEARYIEAFSAGSQGWVLEGYFQENDKVKIPPFEAIELDLLDLWGEQRETPPEIEPK